MSQNLPSLDIDLLSVRRIIPFRYGYTTYESNVLFVTDSNGELQGITLENYFSTFGIITPSSIAPYLSDALISTSYSVVNSSLSTVAYTTNSTIFQSLLPSTYQFLYSTMTSTFISTILRVDANVSTLSSFVFYNNSAQGTSSLSTSLARVLNITQVGFSTLSTTIGQGTLSTLCTINLALQFMNSVYNPSIGLSSLSTSLSANFSSLSTVLSLKPIGIPGLCSLSTVVFTSISTIAAGSGISSLSTLTARDFIRFNSARGLSSLSTVVSQSISSFSTSIGRNPPNIAGLSSLSTGIATTIFRINAGPGTSTLSTNMGSFFSSFSTGIYSNPPGITGISSLFIVVSQGFSSIAAGDGVSSISSMFGPGLSSIAAGEGVSSLSTFVGIGFSLSASGEGLSTLSTSISLGLSSVACSLGLSSLSTSISLVISSINTGSGLSSLSTAVSKNTIALSGSTGISTLSTYVNTLSTIDIQYSGFFDFISTKVRNLHRFTDKPALGINCYPDPAASLDVNGMTQFRSTVYLTNTYLAINREYNSIPRSDLDVSGNILTENIFVNNMGTFGTSVTAQEFLTPSDRSLKKNIVVIENALSSIQHMRGVHFQWIKDEKQDIGCIAQEVKEAIPEAVQKHGTESYLVVAYEKIIPVLIESIKELSERVDTIERVIQRIKN
jgi:hypothetical protein